MCPGLRATLEVDPEVEEVEGFRLGFMLKSTRRLDVDCCLETPFDLISRYFFIVGVSGAVKLRISCQHRAMEGTQGDRPTYPLCQATIFYSIRISSY